MTKLINPVRNVAFIVGNKNQRWDQVHSRIKNKLSSTNRDSKKPYVKVCLNNDASQYRVLHMAKFLTEFKSITLHLNCDWCYYVKVLITCNDQSCLNDTKLGVWQTQTYGHNREGMISKHLLLIGFISLLIR